MSDFTSNFRRSKSFRYSMARGLGGRDATGRGDDDMVSTASAAGATTGFSLVCQDCQEIHSSVFLQLIDTNGIDVRKLETLIPGLSLFSLF